MQSVPDRKDSRILQLTHQKESLILYRDALTDVLKDYIYEAHDGMLFDARLKLKSYKVIEEIRNCNIYIELLNDALLFAHGATIPNSMLPSYSYAELKMEGRDIDGPHNEEEQSTDENKPTDQ